tara:strand:- start:281128 stop:281775 length:648 start_codon:yes stop_codon:yes gene_type:complete
MITILPNWHPIFVHFSIGLLGTSVLFYFAAALLRNDHKWKQQWQHMANWSLWSGCLVTLFTISAGWYAYNTVAHDGASHAAMTLHRNWALVTASLFLILGLVAINIVKRNKAPRTLFLSFSAIALALLMITGFLGGEAVYRHGLGVLSLPSVEAGGHHQDHNHGTANHHTEETIAEPEAGHHLSHDVEPNMTIDTKRDQHSHDAEATSAPHEHNH